MEDEEWEGSHIGRRVSMSSGRVVEGGEEKEWGGVDVTTAAADAPQPSSSPPPSPTPHFCPSNTALHRMLSSFLSVLAMRMSRMAILCTSSTGHRE